ncbi:cyclic electron transport protein PGR5 [Lyngbya confervoides]|uniref:Electron transporter n=1 Tax=Lyngbya confervoides BDU141951 TaxID=1574623 RepID=A0ABD4T670_9CYAN|nr:electron transporter [Lyngbya confervoides]MCM1983944.1 electron transporter [Lyngbya confervoides BDU141951]
MFAPLVIILKSAMGQTQFIKLRGKAIALHSKVITNVCNRLGIDRTERQNYIRMARDNGKILGLLA